MPRLWQKYWFRGGIVSMSVVFILGTIALAIIRFNLLPEKIGYSILFTFFDFSAYIYKAAGSFIDLDSLFSSLDIGGEEGSGYIVLFSIPLAMLQAFLVGAFIGVIVNKIRPK